MTTFLLPEEASSFWREDLSPYQMSESFTPILLSSPSSFESVLKDFYYAILYALILAVLRNYMNPIFRTIAAKLAKQSKKGRKRIKETPHVLTRFCEQSWKFLFHSFSTGFLLYYFQDEQWWFPNVGYGFSSDQMRKPYSREIKFIYMLQLAYHGQSLIWYWFSEEQKKADALQTLFHHFVTCFLIIVSYIYNWPYIGILVQYVHDISDIVVALTKMANYVKWEMTSYFIFAVMILIWIYYRLYVYPMYIIQSAIFDVVDCRHVNSGDYCHGTRQMHYIILFGLFSLLGLHAFWCYKFFEILYNLIFNYSSSEEHDRTE